MSLVDFLKEAGEKLIASQAGSAIDSKNLMQGVVDYVGKMGLSVKNLNVLFDQGTSTATVSGEVPDEQTKEKVVLCVGNVSGVSKVNDQLTCTNPPPVTETSEYYQVKSGDTLSKIAKHYYGDANKYNVIFEANKPMLTHPDKIYPGQTLRIPK